MQDLGQLGGGDQAVAITASVDGQVVIGTAYDADLNGRPFRWTQSGGMQDLGTLGWFTAWMQAASASGNVVAGWAHTSPSVGGNMRGFRWTELSGIQEIGTLGGAHSQAVDCSADGSVLVGWSMDSTGSMRAMRWVASGGTLLFEPLPPATQAVPTVWERYQK